MQVKCKFCSNFEEGICQAKKSGGKHPHVKPNSNRSCSKYSIDPIALAAEADKAFERGKIPIYSPTWRYWATNKELDKYDARKGPKYVRLNPGSTDKERNNDR